MTAGITGELAYLVGTVIHGLVDVFDGAKRSEPVTDIDLSDAERNRADMERVLAVLICTSHPCTRCDTQFSREG